MGRNKRKEECAKDADALEASAADSGERTSPPVTRRREQPRAGDVLIQVECGLNVGQVCLNKLRHGSRGACVKFDGNWMTPNQFQMISGRETAKDWKRSIKHHGKTLKSLMNNELLLLEPPVCLCEVCTADDAVKTPSEAATNDPSLKTPLGGQAASKTDQPLPTASTKGKSSNKYGVLYSSKNKKVKAKGEKKLDIRIPAVFEKMKRKVEVTDSIGPEIRKKIKTLIERSSSRSDIYEFVNELSDSDEKKNTDSGKDKDGEAMETENAETGTVHAEEADVGSESAESGKDNGSAIPSMDEGDVSESDKQTAAGGAPEEELNPLDKCAAHGEELSQGKGHHEPHRKSSKGSRLSSIIDELRRNKQQSPCEVECQDVEMEEKPTEATESSCNDEKPTEEGQSSHQTKPKEPKQAKLLPNKSRGDNPKIATVPPLSVTKKPSLTVQPSKKSPRSKAETPKLSKDFLNITNPAHFSWYLPYYASLGLANMMMVPFLSSQMMALQSTENSSEGESETKKDIEKSKISSKSPCSLASSSTSQTPPVTLRKGISPDQSDASKIAASIAPLDLSRTSSVSFVSSTSKSKELPTLDNIPGAEPLDLSYKPSVSSTKHTKDLDPEISKKSTSRRKGTPRMNTPRGSSGFLNPSLDAISKWSTEDVVKFVATVEGCQKYSKNFRSFGVCGKSLPYLSLDHMTGLLQMGHSSAVSLRSAIDRLLLLPGSVASNQSSLP